MDPRPHPEWPLVVANGLGVDSAAMLVEFAGWKVVPDLILFADTGGEKPETYQYLLAVQQYLGSVGFPPVVTVRYHRRPRRTGRSRASASTLARPVARVRRQELQREVEADPGRLPHSPALPTGRVRPPGAAGHGCDWVRRVLDEADVRRGGQDDRARRGRVAAPHLGEAGARRCGRPAVPRGVARRALPHLLVPADGLGIDRAACERAIRDTGLPVPVKSACFFCPASKKAEILSLRVRHSRLLARALAVEANARPNLTTVRGLGRSFAWADFLDAVDRPPLFPNCT